MPNVVAEERKLSDNHIYGLTPEKILYFAPDKGENSHGIKAQLCLTLNMHMDMDSVRTLRSFRKYFCTVTGSLRSITCNYCRKSWWHLDNSVTAPQPRGLGLDV